MKVYGTDAPCKDCTERKVGCHSSCERYLKWKEGATEVQKEQISIWTGNNRTTWNKFFIGRKGR